MAPSERARSERALSDRPAERHQQVAGLFTERVPGTRSWDAPAPVAGWAARDGFPLRDQLGPLPGERRRALPQQQRNEVDAHLVEQARPEQLPGDVRT